MKKVIEENNRREFLKKCGVSTVPFLLPAVGLNAMPWSETNKINLANNPEIVVNFIYDGLDLTPRQYIEKLAEIHIILLRK